MRLPALLLLSLAPLAAGDPADPRDGNRFGATLTLVQPTSSRGSGIGTGLGLTLQVHYARDTRFMSRFYVGYQILRSTTPITEAYWNGYTYAPVSVDREWRSLSVGYEIMPHLGPDSRQGAYFIVGVGATGWEERRSAAYGSTADAHHQTSPASTYNLGAGWRFNPHATLEFRLLKEFRQDQRTDPRENVGSDTLAFGVGFRI